jgi:hypothetical protein
MRLSDAKELAAEAAPVLGAAVQAVTDAGGGEQAFYTLDVADHRGKPTSVLVAVYTGRTAAEAIAALAAKGHAPRRRA